ncbi:hypothetical protein OHW85_22555, partial [Acinetobacter baumannii]|nr:hypothetical protein [Acinetobacter baumannii]
MLEEISTLEDLEKIEGQDYVLIKLPNNKSVVGQVASDRSCVFLSLIDNELSRVLLYPELVVRRIGNTVELIKNYPITFSLVKDIVSNSKDSDILEYKNDSLFIIKVMHTLLERHSLWGKPENLEFISSNLTNALKDALEDEVNIKDVQYTLSNYI